VGFAVENVLKCLQPLLPRRDRGARRWLPYPPRDRECLPGPSAVTSVQRNDESKGEFCSQSADSRTDLLAGKTAFSPTPERFDL